jgi:hypothetical protein
LGTYHPDALELQALGPVRGEQAHGIAPRRPFCNRLRRDLLTVKGGEEGRHSHDSAIPLRGALGCIEERDDGVDVVVGTRRPGERRRP